MLAVCYQWALTGKQTLLGGAGAHQPGDLRLPEDGGERGGALGSDAITLETACKGCVGQ